MFCGVSFQDGRFAMESFRDDELVEGRFGQLVWSVVFGVGDLF
jgi:hypothetical protein